MTSDGHFLESIVNVINPIDLPAIDVFGPQVSLLTPIDGGADDVCVIRGVLPPVAVVPLHWRTTRPDDYVTVPGNALHAHRSLSDQEAVDLIVTTPRTPPWESSYRRSG